MPDYIVKIEEGVAAEDTLDAAHRFVQRLRAKRVKLYLTVMPNDLGSLAGALNGPAPERVNVEISPDRASFDRVPVVETKLDA